MSTHECKHCSVDHAEEAAELQQAMEWSAKDLHAGTELLNRTIAERDALQERLRLAEEKLTAQNTYAARNERLLIADEIIRRVDTVTLCTLREVEDIRNRALSGEFDDFNERKAGV